MPFDLGDHPTRYRPAPSLIGEARIGSARIIGRAADWPVEQISNPLLQDSDPRNWSISRRSKSSLRTSPWPPHSIVTNPKPAFRSKYEDGIRDVRLLYPAAFYHRIT